MPANLLLDTGIVLFGFALLYAAHRYADRRQRNPVPVDQDEEAYGDFPHVGGR